MYQSPDYMNQPHTVAPAHVIPRRKQVDWRLTGAYIIAGFGLAVALASLWLFSSYKTSAASQVTQLRHQLATVQSAQSKTADNLNGVSSQISSAQGELTLLAPYNSVCTQYLTGPNGGPATFYFPCSMQKPSSGS